MARDYAKINLAIWQDDDWRALTPSQQHLYLAVLTDPAMTYCGVTDWRPNRITQRAAGWTTDAILDAAAVLMDRRLVIVDEITEEIAVRSFLRHDGVMQHNKLCITAMTSFTSIASNGIRGVIVHELNRLRGEFPDWPSWSRRQVSEVLKRAALEPDVAPGLAPGLASRLAPNATLSLGVPYTSTSTSTKHQHREEDKSSSPSPAAPTTHSDPTEFDEFWDIYPRKVGKDAARKAFAKAVKRADFQTIVDGAQRVADDPNLPDRQFVKHPATWLNSGGWDDEPFPARAPNLAAVPNQPWKPPPGSPLSYVEM